MEKIMIVALSILNVLVVTQCFIFILPENVYRNGSNFRHNIVSVKCTRYTQVNKCTSVN